MEWDNLQLLRRSFYETRGGEIETDYEDIWTLDINFSRDVLAGMLAIGIQLVNHINETEQEDIVFGLNKGFEFKVVYTIKDFDESYYAFTVEDIIEEYYPPEKSYGIWIRNEDDREFDMYTFDNAQEFMQGFITMANNFGVDFIDYLASLPFDSNGIYYDLPDYHVKALFEEDIEAAIENKLEEHIRKKYYL